MQNRIDQLMELTPIELQKRGVATLIATIASEETYDDVKIEAIKALSEAQKTYSELLKYYNDTYDEIYEDVVEDITSFINFSDEAPRSSCFCNFVDDCEDYEDEDETCDEDESSSYNDMDIEEESPVLKPKGCTCEEDCSECADSCEPCKGSLCKYKDKVNDDALQGCCGCEAGDFEAVLND